MFKTSYGRIAARRFGAAHTVSFIVLIITMLIASPQINPDAPLWAYGLLAAQLIPIVFVIADIIVIWRYVRKAKPVIPDITFREAYFFGASWSDMALIASHATDAVRLFEEERAERARKRAEAAKRKELRLARRQERLTGEQQALAHQGLELGIDKGELENALRRGLDETRALIAYYERRAALLERAKKVGCESMTLSDLAAGEEHAAIRLAKAEALLTKADYYGIGAEVRTDLARGGIEFADYKVVKAEREAKRTAAIGELRRSIDTIPEGDRHGLYVQLTTLRDCEFEGREYRRLKYALERDIDGVRARSRAS